MDSHWRASRSIEHPQRQFQPTTGRALIMATAGHGARHLVDHLMNLNGASCPRMPKIENFALLGPMGVASYNGKRPHQSLDGATPDQAYFTKLPLRVAA